MDGSLSLLALPASALNSNCSYWDEKVCVVCESIFKKRWKIDPLSRLAVQQCFAKFHC